MAVNFEVTSPADSAPLRQGAARIRETRELLQVWADSQLDTLESDPSPVTTYKNNWVTGVMIQNDDTTDANRAITTDHIKDLQITEPKLVDDSVSTRTIQDGAVNAARLATDAVETVKIKDANVTVPKLVMTGGSLKSNPVSSDEVLIGDSADGGAAKRALLSSLVPVVGGVRAKGAFVITALKDGENMEDNFVEGVEFTLTTPYLFQFSSVTVQSSVKLEDYKFLLTLRFTYSLTQARLPASR